MFQRFNHYPSNRVPVIPGRSNSECIYISYGGTSETVKVGRTLHDPLGRMHAYNRDHRLDHDKQIVVRVDEGTALPVETLSHELLKAKGLQSRCRRHAKELFQCSPSKAKSIVKTSISAIRELHRQGVRPEYFDELRDLGEQELQRIWEVRREEYVKQSTPKYAEFETAWSQVQVAAEKVERRQAWRNLLAVAFTLTLLALMSGSSELNGYTLLAIGAFVWSHFALDDARNEHMSRVCHPAVRWYENEYRGKSSACPWELKQHWSREGEHWTDFFSRLGDTQKHPNLRRPSYAPPTA